MTRLIYDGTFEGLLCVVFEIYQRKLDDVYLQRTKALNEALFENVIDVPTDDYRANRVLKGLGSKMSPFSIQRLYIAHLAETSGDENAIAGFIRYALNSNTNIEDDYGNRYVLRVSQIVGMMRREKHRMEAFIRFQKLEDGTFYALIEPDFNVLPLLIKHFKSRYADQKWMIYDKKRKYGLYYDLHDTQFISLEFSDQNSAANVTAIFSQDERIYQELWKNYFDSTNIPARKNTRLHIKHIPKRYWKHLTEKF